MACEDELAADSDILNPIAPPTPETEIEEDGNDTEVDSASDQEIDRGVTAKRKAEIDVGREMVKKLQMPT